MTVDPLFGLSTDQSDERNSEGFMTDYELIYQMFY